MGNPFSPGGLTLGQAVGRRVDRGSPGVLDPSDDTDDSASDFVATPPAPRNNAGVTGATAGFDSTPSPPGPIAFGAVVVGFALSSTLSVRETGARTLTISHPVLGADQDADPRAPRANRLAGPARLG